MEPVASDYSELTINPVQKSKKIGTPFQKPWKKLLHAGNSRNLLRFDVREQIKNLQEELEFEYVYLNNLFHPAMKIEIASGTCNFSEIRKVLDYIISLGMHPYIELETQENTVIKKMGNSAFNAGIHSQLILLTENQELLDSFLLFLLRRYGEEELSKWYISIERSTALNNLISEQEYFRCYSFLYHRIKKLIPHIRIGGPDLSVGKPVPCYEANRLGAKRNPRYHMEFHALLPECTERRKL